MQHLAEPPGPGADLQHPAAARHGALDRLRVEDERDPVTEAALPAIPLGVAEVIIVGGNPGGIVRHDLLLAATGQP